MPQVPLFIILNLPHLQLKSQKIEFTTLYEPKETQRIKDHITNATQRSQGIGRCSKDHKKDVARLGVAKDPQYQDHT